jgi:hypothetical protein
MRFNRLTVAALATLSITASLAYQSPPAQALVGHKYQSSFGPGGPGTGTFLNIQGIAVDQSTGDVYVLSTNRETERALINKFNAAGEPQEFTALKTNTLTPAHTVGFSGLAVSSAGPTKGDIYYAPSYRPEIYGSDGSFLGEITEHFGCDVAVDSNGDVYLGEGGGNIYKYVPTANPVTNADYVSSIGGLEGLCDIGVDSEGSVYVDTHPDGPVTKYPASKFTEPLASGMQIDPKGDALTVDPSTNDVYIDEGSDVAEYDPAGNLITTFAKSGPGAIAGSIGIAVYAPTPTTPTVYVANNASGTVEIFGSTGVVPDVSTKPAQQEVQSGKIVTLEGTVNPDGTTLTACQVEYGPTLSYGQTAPCTSTPAGETTTVVKANLEPLPGTFYYYRFDAANSNGSNQGSDYGFMTPGAIEDRSTVATDVSQLTATLNATVDPGLLPTGYHFEYGTTSAYGSIAPNPDLYLSPVQKDEEISQTLTGLQAGTTYHFALVINDAAGTFTSPDETFTTAAVPPPVVSTGGAGEVGLGSALLSGSIDPRGWETTYHFEYGPTTAYGSSWPTIDVALGAFNAAQPIASFVQNLLPGTVYHYRLVATNAGGTEYGADQTFATPAYPPSVVQEAPTLSTKLSFLNPEAVGIAPPKQSKPKRKPKAKAHKHARKHRTKHRKKR